MPDSVSIVSSTHTSATPRRRFLSELGLAACAGLLATERPAAELLAADPKPAAKRKKPAANSGVAGIREILERKDAPITWVFTGDSITHGALHTYGWRSYPEHFAERVRWEMRRMRDIVVNTGISGDRTQGLLADLDWRVLHLRPDVVSVMLGMNDCSFGPVGRDLFRKELTAIVNKIMAAGAIPILNTPNTVDETQPATHGDLAGYAQVVRDVSLGTKAVLVDHYAHWEKTKSAPEELRKWLDATDATGIHPGYFGHRELARLIFRELEIFDEESPTCRLDVP